MKPHLQVRSHLTRSTICSHDLSPASTPWIALISCDANATNVNLDNDIFTLARDKGAVAAVGSYILSSILSPSQAAIASYYIQ